MAKSIILPPMNILEALFSYNANTGELRWKVDRGGIKAGQRAGCLDKARGDRVVRVNRVLYGEHRVIWKMHYKEEPPMTIGHLNGLADDNCVENLYEYRE